MALRFSDRFLSRLGQTPSFGKRLSNIAGGLTAYPGMIAEQNKIKDMGMLELAQYQREKARTPEEIIRTEKQLQGVKSQLGQESIDLILGQALQQTDPAEIARFGKAITSVGSQMGVPTASINNQLQGLMTTRREDLARRQVDAVKGAMQQIYAKNQDPTELQRIEQATSGMLTSQGQQGSLIRGAASDVVTESRRAEKESIEYNNLVGNQKLNQLNEEFLSTNDYEELQRIEQEKRETAKSYNLDASQFVGAADKRYDELQTASFNRATEQDKRDEYLRQKIEDNIFNSLIANNQTEVPDEFPDADGNKIRLDPKTTDNLRERFQAYHERKIAFDKARGGAPLDKNYLSIGQDLIKREGFEKLYPGLKEALAKEEKTRGQIFSTERKAAIKTVEEYVKTEAERLRRIKLSDDSIDITIDAAIRNTIARPDKVITVWGIGETYSDFFENNEPGSEAMNSFYKKARIALKENPDLTPIQIVDAGMEGMEDLYPDEETQRLREGTEAQIQQNIDFTRYIAIQQLMNEMGIQNEVEAGRILDERRDSALRQATAETTFGSMK